MRPFDLFLYLFGHRAATQRIAASRRAWLVGAILVLSAGVARNYDHLDLLRNPEWIIGPFAASLVSILFIFAWLSPCLKLGKAGPIPQQLGTFLTLAWLTAPCAWLYGIPVEGMTDLVTATKWNIAFLAVVALWRVAIIVRAVSVLAEVSPLRVLPLVLAPAALEMMIGSFFKSLSLIGIMGGVRLPPHTELLKQASDFTAVASFWTFVVASLGCFLARTPANKPLNRPEQPLARGCWRFAAAALLLWLAMAVPYHRPIADRDRLARLINQARYQEAVQFAASKSRDRFSGIHEFPSGHDRTAPLELLAALPAESPAWLRQEWTDRAVEKLSMRVYWTPELLKQVSNHPEVMRRLQERATSLRAGHNLDFEDSYWLKGFDEAASGK